MNRNTNPNPAHFRAGFFTPEGEAFYAAAFIADHYQDHVAAGNDYDDSPRDYTVYPYS